MAACYDASKNGYSALFKPSGTKSYIMTSGQKWLNLDKYEPIRLFHH